MSEEVKKEMPEFGLVNSFQLAFVSGKPACFSNEAVRGFIRMNCVTNKDGVMKFDVHLAVIDRATARGVLFINGVKRAEVWTTGVGYTHQALYHASTSHYRKKTGKIRAAKRADAAKGGEA